jgi:hypothetical protein
MSMAFDCEPIFFNYNNKLWMIELWKGQYGLETGCEIGVYNRSPSNNSPLYALLDRLVGKRPNDPDPSHSMFFDCVDDNEMLNIAYTLNRRGTKLFSRGPENHWWLTGFKWGVFSDASDLSMSISITFPTVAMMTAFSKALQALQYNNTVSGNTVSFAFDKPKTFQPRTATPNVLSNVVSANQALVAKYNALSLPNNDPNNIPMNGMVSDQLSMLTRSLPIVLKAAGASVDEVLDVLTNKLGFSKENASALLAKAGYAISDWAKGVANLLNLGSLIDFSTMVVIVNTGSSADELSRGPYPVNHGNYAIEPPSTIHAGETAHFLLSGTVGFGSDAFVTYLTSKGQQIKFSFSCPQFSGNSVVVSPSTSFDYYATVGSLGWGGRNTIQSSGQWGGEHPMTVAFVWPGGKPPPK